LRGRMATEARACDRASAADKKMTCRDKSGAGNDKGQPYCDNSPSLGEKNLSCGKNRSQCCVSAAKRPRISRPFCNFWLAICRHLKKYQPLLFPFS